MSSPALYSHLGRGIAFPLKLSVQGGIAISSDDRNIRESIQIILGTKLGERVYRPDFGCRLSELTFAPMNPQTLLLARVFVKDALTQWEPRINTNVTAVDVRLQQNQVIAIAGNSTGRVQGYRQDRLPSLGCDR